jgi:hypothetical protein
MPDRRPIRQRLRARPTAAERDAWITRPLPARGGLPPRQPVDRGEAEAVHRRIDRMNEGAYP